MKKSLLTLSLLAALTSVSAEEFYIIKDGKLADGVEVLPYDEATEGPSYEDGVEVAGATAAKITDNKQYTETRFYVPNGINLLRTWNVEIEFYYNAADIDSATHAGDNKWQMIDIAYHEDTTGGNYTLKNVLADNTFDVKVKDKPGVWNIEKQFVYVQPTHPTIKEVIFGWQRQIDPTKTAIGPVYIKNLKFTGEGNKPFYYENFDLLGAVNAEYVNEVEKYEVANGAVTEHASSIFNVAKYPDADPFAVVGGWVSPLSYYAVVDEDCSTRQLTLSAKRCYEPNATDGSEYYDAEVLKGMDVIVPSGSSRKATGRAGRNFCLVPLTGIPAGTLTLDFIAKWDAGQAASTTYPENLTASTSEDSLELPFKYAFVDDALSAATCELTPATSELLNGMWTAYSSSIEYDGNAKYIALVYDRPKYFSYVVDNIRLTSDGIACSTVLYDAEGITAYTSVENILNDVKVSVFPVPATDVVTVVNEGVESVAIVNAAGSVVATANGNQVNVAGLASGMYIVKAYTANGVLVAKIIKK